MRYLSLSLIALTLCSMPLRSADTAIRTIWAVNDGERVEHDDLNNPNKSRNSVWDGHKIRVFAARNEVVAFQVIVEAGDKGIDRLSISLNELAQTGGSNHIAYLAPDADPTVYAGRPIQLFSENYMNITEPTSAEWIFKAGKPGAPADPTGWKPVQLVPENAKQGKGGFPVRVAPRQNQAFWIEVYTRRDLPGGFYQGNVLVKADGYIQNVPVELQVFDFTLPDENSMHAMIFYQGGQPELYQGKNLDPQYHRFAHRNRVELVHGYSIPSVEAAIGRFSGAEFTREKGYEGPGESVGNVIVPATFYGPGRDFDVRESAWAKSDTWMNFIQSRLPQAITFVYMPDEPGPARFDYIRKVAENIHSNPGPGRKLPVFVTRRYTPALEGAIDIWDSGPEGFDIEQARKEREKGRDCWVYNGGRPAGGAITNDAPATDARATIWACFKHEIKVYFYWHGVHWEHNSQKAGDRRQNVWANPITFDNRGQPRKPIADQGFSNGDGVLMYPGEEKLHPDEDRGITGPCSTLQLANFRRGLQDHQYLTMARKLGLNALVDEMLDSVVPRVFSDAKDRIGFAENGNSYEQARLKLANAIAALSGRPRQ